MENSSSKNKAKPIKLGKNDIICPNCSTVLNISEDLIDEEFIQCSKCESAILNPLIFGDKNVICYNCGNNSPLPRAIENELIVTCGGCGIDIVNTYSDKYNPITCPYCEVDIHISEELAHHKYINCSNCGRVFKNTKIKPTAKNLTNKKDVGHTNDSTKETNKVKDEPILTKSQRNWLIAIAVIIIIVIIGVLSDNISSTSSSSLYLVNTDTYAATSKSAFDDMFRYINDGDQQALSILIINGQVITLYQGTEVFLENSHFSYCIVRITDSTQKLWIVAEHITKK